MFNHPATNYIFQIHNKTCRLISVTVITRSKYHGLYTEQIYIRPKQSKIVQSASSDLKFRDKNFDVIAEFSNYRNYYGKFYLGISDESFAFTVDIRYRYSSHLTITDSQYVMEKKYVQLLSGINEDCKKIITTFL